MGIGKKCEYERVRIGRVFSSVDIFITVISEKGYNYRFYLTWVVFVNGKISVNFLFFLILN